MAGRLRSVGRAKPASVVIIILVKAIIIIIITKAQPAAAGGGWGKTETGLECVGSPGRRRPGLQS